MQPILFPNLKYWWCAFTLLFSFGCGPGLLEGPLIEDAAEKDTVDPPLQVPTDSDIDTDDPFQTVGNSITLCPPETSSLCSAGNWSMFELDNVISARWLSQPAWFTHMSENVLLGFETRADILTPVAIYVPFKNTSYEEDFINAANISTLPDEMLSAIDLNGETTSFKWVGATTSFEKMLGSPFRELGAFYQNGQYQLVGVPRFSTSKVVAPLSGSHLKTSAELTKMVYLQSASVQKDAALDRICMFGEGLFCFDGTRWATEISPTQCDFLQDVSITPVDNTPVIVAADANGTIHFKSSLDLHEVAEPEIDTDTHSDSNLHDSEKAPTALDEGSSDGWRTIPPADSNTVLSALSVNTYTFDFTAAGDGVLLHGSVDGEIARCEVEPNIQHFVYYTESSEFVIIDAEGTLWTGILGSSHDGQLCNTKQQIEDAIDGSPFGEYYYVLTPTALSSWANRHLMVAE